MRPHLRLLRRIDWTSPACLVFAVGLLVVTFVSVRAGADPDLWGHVRFGQDILAAGAIVKVDPYSFTSDREWVNHEWLAEVAMALAWNQGGTAGLVALKALLLLATLALVGWAAHRERVPSLAVWLLVVLAAVGVVPRATAVRPQLFSLLLFAAQMVILTEHERRGRRALLLGLPPLYALWVNLHGGWLVGGGVLALWTVGHVLERRGTRLDHLWLTAVGLLALLATLVNPYGLGMWRFLADTVGFGRDHIADWQPVWNVPAPLVSWAVVAAVAGLLCAERCVPVTRTGPLLVALLGLGSLKVNRLDAFFALSAVITLVPAFGEAARRLERRGDGASRSQTLAPAAACAVYLLVGVTTAHRVAAQIVCIPVSAQDEYPEPEALAWLESTGTRGRAVTFFNHGEFLIWHLAPDVKVSMDGRRETVYSDAVVDAHARLYNAPAEGSDYPDSVGADLVLLPNSLGAAKHLEARGWRPAFMGPTTTVFTRGPGRAPTRSSAPPLERCFPAED